MPSRNGGGGPPSGVLGPPARKATRKIRPCAKTGRASAATLAARNVRRLIAAILDPKEKAPRARGFGVLPCKTVLRRLAGLCDEALDGLGGGGNVRLRDFGRLLADLGHVFERGVARGDRLLERADSNVGRRNVLQRLVDERHEALVPLRDAALGELRH